MMAWVGDVMGWDKYSLGREKRKNSEIFVTINPLLLPPLIPSKPHLSFSLSHQSSKEKEKQFGKT